MVSQSLPIIDISPYLSETPDELAKRPAVSAALHKACIEYGFFYLDISSYIDPREPEELTALAKSFFLLPEEEKDKITLRCGDNARGGYNTPLSIERLQSHHFISLSQATRA